MPNKSVVIEADWLMLTTSHAKSTHVRGGISCFLFFRWRFVDSPIAHITVLVFGLQDSDRLTTAAEEIEESWFFFLFDGWDRQRFMRVMVMEIGERSIVRREYGMSAWRRYLLASLIDIDRFIDMLAVAVKSLVLMPFFFVHTILFYLPIKIYSEVFKRCSARE